ncbi:MAG: helix-turn-helix transcriptional regulator, partial [Bacteroidota bacterium]
DNLFRVRQKLQVRYGQFSNKQSTTAIEDPFLKKFYTEVENEISNTNLGMVQLSRSLGMSRSQLFRKTKALTGKSPSTFIRSIRLQKGKQLLETTDLSVSQVAYEVGFTSLNYFSRTFIEEFGINPTATRK